jgi:hypothetical protein
LKLIEFSKSKVLLIKRDGRAAQKGAEKEQISAPCTKKD